MQLILDNLLATIIASTVFLMLMALTIRNQELVVDATNNYALKAQELNFIEVLKQDLHGVSQVYTPAEDPTDSTFSFRTRIAPPDTTTAIVAYKRVWTGNRNGVDFFQIQRSVNGTASGASMVTVSKWQIVSLTSDGEAVLATELDRAEQIYVRFEAAAPFKDDEIVTLSRWETTFRPRLLRPGNVLL